MTVTIAWQWAPFDALDGAAVHAMLALRQQVFVLEQQCLYADIDGRDPRALHLLGRVDDGNGASQLAAYLRVLAPGDKRDEAVIGRVLTAPFARNLGIGRALMAEGVRRTAQAFPAARIHISAQQHLQAFYREFGFAPVSGSYLEDGIPHIDMLR